MSIVSLLAGLATTSFAETPFIYSSAFGVFDDIPLGYLGEVVTSESTFYRVVAFRRPSGDVEVFAAQVGHEVVHAVVPPSALSLTVLPLNRYQVSLKVNMPLIGAIDIASSARLLAIAQFNTVGCQTGGVFVASDYSSAVVGADALTTGSIDHRPVTEHRPDCETIIVGRVEGVWTLQQSFT